IDGGNSYYRDDIVRAKELKAYGVHYVDVGTSGGVWGLDRGYCLMIGGEDAVVERLQPIFLTIAPGTGTAEPPPGRQPGGTADAFAKSPDLSDFSGRVSDSGEGRWTVLAAVDEGVPASVIAASLYERFESRDLGAFTGQILSAMRSEFGGHAEKKA